LPRLVIVELPRAVRPQLALLPMALLELLLFIALLPAGRCEVLPGEQLLLTALFGSLVLLRVVSVAALEPAFACANAIAGVRTMAAATNIGWNFMRVSSSCEECNVPLHPSLLDAHKKLFAFSSLSFVAGPAELSALQSLRQPTGIGQKNLEGVA